MKLIAFLMTIILLLSCVDNEKGNFTIEDDTVVQRNSNSEDFSIKNYTWLEGKWRDNTSNKRNETHEVWFHKEDSIDGVGFYV